MEKPLILEQVELIFKDVLDNDEIVLNLETTTQDIDEWDSLSHIQLVIAIEKKFKIKFTSSEMLTWKNVGEIVNSISEKLN